jgi:hypothetical protein
LSSTVPGITEHLVGRGVDHGGLVIEDHLGTSGRAAAGHGLPVARHRIGEGLIGKAFGREAGGKHIAGIPLGLAADHQRRFENVQHCRGLATRQAPR